VAVVGDSENPHAHRIVVENGGLLDEPDVGFDNVVLVSNFDQTQYEAGVLGRVGFSGHQPPIGDGVDPEPEFVDFDEDGEITTCVSNSPVLTVTGSHLRVHQLQGNFHESGVRDQVGDGGGDLVLLEIWRVFDSDAEPEDCGPPRISYSPQNEVDFGAVEVGRSASAGVTIENVGAGTLRVSARLTSQPSAFEIASTPAVFILDAGTSALLELRYTPTAEGDDSGELGLLTNDPSQPVALISLLGSGTPAVDCFEFSEDSPFVQDADLEPDSDVELCVVPTGFLFGRLVLLSLTDDDPEDVNRLYARYGKPPTVTGFDKVAAVPGEATQRLVMPADAAELRVLLQGNGFHNVDNQVTFKAEIVRLALTGMVPQYAGGATTVNATIFGGGLTDLMDVFLVGEGGTHVPATILSVPGTGNRAHVRFTFAGEEPAGLYDLVAELDLLDVTGAQVTATARVPDAFRVLASAPGPSLEVELNVGPIYRRDRSRTVYILFRNAGGQETAEPSFRVEARRAPDAECVVPGPSSLPILLAAEDDNFSPNPIAVVGDHPTAPDGVLPPTESFVQLPVHFRAEDVGCVRFQVFNLITDALLASAGTRIVASIDPNTKEGPGGTGGGDLIAPEQDLPYGVHFENMGTGVVQTMQITDTLDADLDICTFQFQEVLIGGNLPLLPDPVTCVSNGSWETTYTMTVANSGTTPPHLLVEVKARLDFMTREIRWNFETLGVNDDSVGFLTAVPPDGEPSDNIAQRQGTVWYTVTPLPPTQKKTEVTNEATIDFNDGESQQTTNEVLRRIVLPPDPPTYLSPPNTSVAPQPVVLSWNAADGADFYDVYVWQCAQDPAVTCDYDQASVARVTGLNYQPPGLSSGDTCWKVVAVNEGGCAEGLSWRFKAGDLAFKRGDATGEGDINITDGVRIFNWLFSGDKIPPCLDAADTDDTGDLNIADGIFVLNWLFTGGDEPPAPGPFLCGTDPMADDTIDCRDYKACP